MNKMIEQIAKEAGIKIEYWMTNPPKPCAYSADIAELEKFAELVIKECASIAAQYVIDNKWKDEGISVFWLQDSIKERFGVEQ